MRFLTNYFFVLFTLIHMTTTLLCRVSGTDRTISAEHVSFCQVFSFAEQNLNMFGKWDIVLPNVQLAFSEHVGRSVNHYLWCNTLQTDPAVATATRKYKDKVIQKKWCFI